MAQNVQALRSRIGVSEALLLQPVWRMHVRCSAPQRAALTGGAAQVTTYRIYNVASGDPRNPLRTGNSGADGGAAPGWGSDGDAVDGDADEVQHSRLTPGRGEGRTGYKKKRGIEAM